MSLQNNGSYHETSGGPVRNLACDCYSLRYRTAPGGSRRS